MSLQIHGVVKGVAAVGMVMAICAAWSPSLCTAQGSRRAKSDAAALQEQLRAIRNAFGETEDKRRELRKKALRDWKGEQTDLYNWLVVESKYSLAFSARKGSSSRRRDANVSFAEAILNALLGLEAKDNDAEETGAETSEHAQRVSELVLAQVKTQKPSSSSTEVQLYKWRKVGAQLKRVMTIFGEVDALESNPSSSKGAVKRLRDARGLLNNAKIDFARTAFSTLGGDDEQAMKAATDQVTQVIRLQSLTEARDQALINWAQIYQNMRLGSESAFAESRARGQVFVREAAVQDALLKLQDD